MSIVRTIVAFAFGLLLPAVAAAQTANLWIDTNGGTCTRQGTPASYSDAAACASIQAALAACTAGDTIRMKTGTYGDQTITATKTAPGCTVIAESATTVGNLLTGGAWYEIQNINGATGISWEQTAGANNITCRNCNFTGSHAYEWGQGPAVFLGESGTSNISWIGGSLRDFSCTNCNSGLFIRGPNSSNLLVEGVTFDNVRNAGGNVNHFEVIRIDGSINGFSLKRSTFTNNYASSSTIFMSNFEGAKPDNLLFENNFFGENGNGYPDASFHFNANFQNSSTCSNWTFRYNTFKAPIEMDPLSNPTDMSCQGGTFSNVVWVGNLFPRGASCRGNTFRYNVGYGSAGSACSGTGNSVTTTAAVALGGAGGFYLQSGSSAIGAGGSGADCIAVDHDNNTRSSPCDAGAHEFGAGASPPDAPTNFRLNIDIWTAIALLGLLGGVIWRALNAPDHSRGGRGRWPAFAVRARQVACRQARSVAA